MTMISKQEQWRKRIDERTSSKLSIQEWCKANAVSPDQYHYWKRKFVSVKYPCDYLAT